jgi:hypothetical protein
MDREDLGAVIWFIIRWGGLALLGAAVSYISHLAPPKKSMTPESLPNTQQQHTARVSPFHPGGPVVYRPGVFSLRSLRSR